MTDSIFDQNDEIDYLNELTQPGGKFDRAKYKTDDELLKAMAKSNFHGDRFIDHKNQEFDQLREDALRWRKESTTQAKLEDLLTRMERKENNSVNTDTNVESHIDLNKIEELATQKAIAAVQKMEIEKKESESLAAVESRIRQRYGSNAASILRDKMNELGLTTEDLKLLAKRSPEAAINALGLNPQPVQHSWSPPSSSVRTDSFKPSADVRDAVYYEKLRKDNPKEYFSEKVSVQRLKDMDHPDWLKRYEEQNNRSF